jgi:hypothetical protein
MYSATEVLSCHTPTLPLRRLIMKAALKVLAWKGSSHSARLSEPVRHRGLRNDRIQLDHCVSKK